jgi:hypothetical protein
MDAFVKRISKESPSSKRTISELEDADVEEVYAEKRSAASLSTPLANQRVPLAERMRPKVRSK